MEATTLPASAQPAQAGRLPLAMTADQDRQNKSRASEYNSIMRRDAAEILKEALELPAEARAALAGSLIAGLLTWWTLFLHRRHLEAEPEPGARIERCVLVHQRA